MKTDLQIIKKKSKVLFDIVSYEEAQNAISSDLRGLFISHPYTNSPFIYLPKRKQLCNILEDKEAAKEYRETILGMIDEADSLTKIVMLLNKPYLLYWFHITRQYMSEKDYAEMLKHIWTISENPNMDINVTTDECIEYFKKANKDYLMDEEEKEVYNNLPDIVTLYRGVSTGRNPYGLSFTPDKDKAIWFQNRFSNGENKGYLLTLKVRKSDCICYLNSRGEKEIILDYIPYKNDIKKQNPNCR